MELALLRTLMDKDFHDNHKGIRCPNNIFSKDGRKIKATIDNAITEYGRSVTPIEVEALFFSKNPTITTAQKSSYQTIFDQIDREVVMGADIAGDVLSDMFRQQVGEEIANLGFEYVNGEHGSLEPLRAILDNYNEDFTPNLSVEWANIDMDYLLERSDLEAQWKFNLPTLARKVEGVSGGHLIMIGARPETGKTSSHASFIAGPNGFAEQGAKCVILCNEEIVTRVASRYLSASTGMTLNQIRDNPSGARAKYQKIKDQVKFMDATGKDMSWVESVIKSYKPDIVVIDMGDKFAKPNGAAREDMILKANAIYARDIAKQYECALFYMSQLSAEAEGKVILNQSMMEGSKTGKASEADLMLLIAKNPAIGDDDTMEDPMRHINITKNKLSGWHGKVTCMLDGRIARYGV
mgnify:FL=1|tara:strand:- start:422 stop:1648 length:1227 start_codon:yes stop_codon:yes gene_type:complete